MRSPSQYLTIEEITGFIKVMKEAGLSKTKIAAWMNVSPSTISYYEKKYCYPSNGTMTVAQFSSMKHEDRLKLIRSCGAMQ